MGSLPHIDSRGLVRLPNAFKRSTPRSPSHLWLSQRPLGWAFTWAVEPSFRWAHRICGPYVADCQPMYNYFRGPFRVMYQGYCNKYLEMESCSGKGYTCNLLLQVRVLRTRQRAGWCLLSSLYAAAETRVVARWCAEALHRRLASFLPVSAKMGESAIALKSSSSAAF